MKFPSVTLACLCLTFFVSSSIHAQNSIDSTIPGAANFELRGDTLISPAGLKIYPGQKCTLGAGAGPNGSYRSIISKYAALVPNIWGGNNGYQFLIENYVDNKKGQKQLQALTSGQTVTIGKITKTGTKQFRFYLTTLHFEADDYRSDILLALQLKELVLE